MRSLMPGRRRSGLRQTPRRAMSGHSSWPSANNRAGRLWASSVGRQQHSAQTCADWTRARQKPRTHRLAGPRARVMSVSAMEQLQCCSCRLRRRMTGWLSEVPLYSGSESLPPARCWLLHRWDATVWIHCRGYNQGSGLCRQCPEPVSPREHQVSATPSLTEAHANWFCG